MKRIVWILGALALTAVTLFSLLVVMLPRETLTARIGQQISAWTGREVSLRGAPEFGFFPELSVTLKDVHVAGPDGMADAEILSMERLEGRIRFWPLLIGEVEIGSFTMVRPQIRLVRQDGAKNWAFDSGAAALQLAFAGDVALGAFRLQDGTVTYEDRGEATTERLDSVNLSIEWPSVRQPLFLGGTGIWRGEQVAFSGSAGEPFEFLNGDATAAEARIESTPMGLEFSGEASDISDPQLTGRLTITTPSLRGFARWLGSLVGPGSTLGEASMAGAASYRAGVLSVENAQLSLDDNNATGALRIAMAAAPDITGTLAFPTIDLTPYFAGVAASFDAGRDWRLVDVETDWFDDFTADVRLSADSVHLGQLRFGNTAASVSLRDMRLEIGVAQAAFSGGSVAGALAVAQSVENSGPAVTTQLRATDVDLAQAGPALALPWPVSGVAVLNADLTGAGTTFGSLLGGVSGTASFELQNGTFPLFGVAEIAAAGPGSAPQQMAVSAPAPIETLSTVFSFADGAAVLSQARIAAPPFSAEVNGRIGLLDGSVNLNGAAVPAAQNLPTGRPVPFAIDGTLIRPVARSLALAN